MDEEGFYLAGEHLEEFADVGIVREEAQAFLDEAAAIISLLWPAFRKPNVHVGAVYQLTEGAAGTSP